MTSVVVPVGIWRERLFQPSVSLLDRKRIFLAGSLHARQGIGVAIDMMTELHHTGASLHIAGGGEALPHWEALVKEKGLTESVTFYGPVSEDRLHQIMHTCCLALAPYLDVADSLSHFADPGKIKHYLQGGLPIVMSRVPHNATTLESKGVALLVPPTPSDLARGALYILEDARLWQRMADASALEATNHLWEKVTEPLLAWLNAQEQPERP
ncbi:MAG: glycosyltransferase [Chloroflexi bacterium]|nr:glycosyltransferase [Chloroflexota bacterium]